jgi:tetratricopeptide (TPR) repeat protein
MNIFLKAANILILILMLTSVKSNATNDVDSIVILKKKLESLNNPKEKLQTLNSVCMLLAKRADKEALTYANRYLELAKQERDRKEQASAAAFIGKIYFEYGDMKQALPQFLFVLQTYKELGNWKKYIAALNNVGGVHRNLRNLDKAYSYFYRALLLNKKLGDSSGISSNLSNIGTVLFDKKRIHEALFYYKQAYAIDTLVTEKDPYKSTYDISADLNNLALAYKELRDYDSALFYSYKNISLTENAGIFFLLTAAYVTTGAIHIDKKDYGQGKKYCLLALNLAKKHNLRDNQAQLFRMLSRIYEAGGDTKQALANYQKYHLLYNSLYDEQNTKQIHQMGAIYESSLKDEQIKSLNKDKEIAFAKAKSESVFTNLIVVISLLMIMMGFIVARNIVLKQRKRLSEEKALAEIQKKRFERDNARLMHENVSAKYDVLKSKINPHFLFNSLAALSSIIPEGAHQAEDFIDHFSDFYRQIIETGEMELIILKDEINIVETYLYLQQIAVGKNLVVDLRIDQHYTQLLVPPFAVQMVVENAIKHNEISNRNPLNISIFTHNDSLVIKNTIQRRTNETVSTGIGEKNITERYKLFSVDLPEFRNADTEYIVTLPLLREKEYLKSGLPI